MTFLVRGIDTAWVAQIRLGGPDAHGQPAVRRRAASTGAAAAPCRHCLRLIDPGDDLLVLAHRPFARLQPYACQRHSEYPQVWHFKFPHPVESCRRSLSG